MSKEYYVYIHRRASDGSVFYVGKGHGRRAFDKTNGRNRYWKFIVSKHGHTVEFYATGLQEWYAFELEKELIAYYGRDNLCNNSDGGEGPAGSIHSEFANIKKSKIVKKSWEKNDARKKQVSERKRKEWSDLEIRNKMISSMQKVQDEMKRSGSKKEYMRNSCPVPVVCLDTGVEYKTIAYAVDWLKSIGKTKSVSCCISYAASGKRKTAYGYRWRYL